MNILSEDDKEKILDLGRLAAEVWKDYPPERLCLPPEFPISPREVVSLSQIWDRARLLLYSESELGLLGGIGRLREVVETTSAEGMENNVQFVIAMKLLWFSLNSIGSAKMKANYLLPL